MPKTTKKKTTKKASSHRAEVILGTATVAAALGAYFLYGSKDAKKNRKQVRGWMLKAKGEVLEKVEMLKDANEDRYHALVDSVLKKYDQMKSVDSEELKALGTDLKKHWVAIQKDARKMTKGKKAKTTKKAKK